MNRGRKLSQKTIGVLFSLCGMGVTLPAWATITIPVNIITVNSIADNAPASGDCTLREAVITANTGTQQGSCVLGSTTIPNEIKFDPSTDGHPIILNKLGAGEDAAATGDLDVTGSTELIIIGNGATKTIIDGDKTDRVFQVLNNANLNLQNLTVQDGAGVAQGGGILAESGTSLSLTSVVVTQNYAANSAGNASGGGIEADGDLTMNTSFVLNNSVQVSTSTSSTAKGGGLYLTGLASTANISLSSISLNSATASNSDAGGGGIDTADPNLNITDSIVSGNTATADAVAEGGGIQIEGDNMVILKRVELSDNIAKSTVVGSSFGGGINSLGYPLALINTTVAGNAAENGRGGGIYMTSSTNSISDFSGATIANNDAAFGGGVYMDGNPVLDMYNTILADNTLNKVPTVNGADCENLVGNALVNAQVYNLIGVVDGCAVKSIGTGNLIGSTANPIDPKLGSLQLIPGAPTPTRALPLLPGSPAIDAGDQFLTTNGGTCYSPDQVGDTRPQDDNGDGTAACDIGAVEYVQPATTNNNNGGGGGGAFGLWELGLLLGIAGVSAAKQVRSNRS